MMKLSNELSKWRDGSMNLVLQVKQVEKYFGRASNLTKALNQIVSISMPVNSWPLWVHQVVGK